ncbi:hypothetical protein VSVS12_02732 [Vibrio scophthalmi]|nr:hypothetical protein VSVS12_02732 [Vibrio scophthalmi]
MDFTTFNGAAESLSFSIWFLVGAAAAMAFLNGLKNVITS